MNKISNQMLVIFGASGDLTARKLIPAIYSLYKENYLPDNFVVLGASRSTISDDDFRKKVVKESSYLKDSIAEDKNDFVSTFSDKLFYEDLGDSYDTDYARLSKRISELNSKYKTDNNYIFYLSTPPSLYETIAKNLYSQELTKENDGWKRIIVEKPFGYSLKTQVCKNILTRIRYIE